MGWDTKCRHYITKNDSMIMPTTALGTMKITKNENDTLKQTKELIKNENGALREPKDGKGRFDLIPYTALLHIAKHYQDGAKIHGERNWEKGIDLKQCFSSALNHALMANDMFAKHRNIDKNNESLEYHLRAAVWNIFVILNDLEV